MLEYLVGVFVCAVASWIWCKSRPSNFPAGPVRLPFINNVYNISTEGHKFTEKMEKLHNKYGPIMSLCLMGWNVWDIWITDFDIIKEVLCDPRFASRKIGGLWEKQGWHKGLTFVRYQEAKVKRKVMSQFLSSLGVGKTSFATALEGETSKLMRQLQNLVGKKTDIHVSRKYLR